MAGLAPFFITGANAKIKINDKTMAFAQNFSYSITVKHVKPKVLGRFEVDSIEPVSYEVTGSFSIIRYAKGAAGAISSTKAGGSFQRVVDGKVVQQEGVSNLKAPNGVSDKGNGVGAWGDDGKDFFNSGRANEAFNPASFKLATFFNIEIWQKLAGGNQCGIARIRDCRIERADFNIAGKTAPAIQIFNFTAIYADEDSFLADFSSTSPAGSAGNQVRA